MLNGMGVEGGLASCLGQEVREGTGGWRNVTRASGSWRSPAPLGRMGLLGRLPGCYPGLISLQPFGLGLGGRHGFLEAESR
jgi:hypothetical protein